MGSDVATAAAGRKSRMLNPRQEKFVALYLGECNGNAVQAARQAGYELSDDANVASAHAASIAGTASVRRRIAEYVKPYTLSAERILGSITERATWTIDDFFVTKRIVISKKPRRYANTLVFDYERARARGKLHLIDAIKVAPDGSVEVKLPKRDVSLALLAKYHGLLVERIQVEHVQADEDAMRAALLDKLRPAIDVTPPAIGQTDPL